MRRRKTLRTLRRGCLAASRLSLFLLSSCGTAVYHDQVTLFVEDSSHRLGSPIEAAFCDRNSGAAVEPGAKERLAPVPIRQEIFSTRGETILGGGSPRTFEFGFFLPALSPDGYYMVELDPVKGERKTTLARFVRFGQYFSDDGAPTVPVRYTASGLDEGEWTVDVTVAVPPP